MRISKTMIRQLRSLITKTYDRKPTLLGRWGTLDPENVKNRKSVLANIDSCGDELCSNPLKLREELGYYEHRAGKDMDSKLIKT